MVDYATQPVQMKRENPRAEFEVRHEQLLNRRTGRIEDLLRTAVSAQAVSRQRDVGTHFALDKQTLDAMTQNVLESAVQGNDFAWRHWRVAVLQAGVQGIGAVTNLSTAGQVAGGFLGGYKEFDRSKYETLKAVQDHKTRMLELLASQRREEANRARGEVDKFQRQRQQLDSEEASAKSNVLRSI